MRYSYVIAIVLCHIVSSTTLIDHDTIAQHIHRARDGKRLHLTMSDEFNVPGRSFASGSDPLFEAVEKPDFTNQALQYYNSSTQYVTTKEGALTILTEPVRASWYEWDHKELQYIKRTHNYTSGMIQSWNKFCFTGGVLEMSIKLPGGYADAGGLWPAAWLMGNLARASFEKSTMNMWPWSYDTCGVIDHLETRQEINACDASPPSGLHPYQGRGAPEIDIFEVMLGHTMPKKEEPTQAFMSSSLQIAPGIPKDQRPKNGHGLNASFLWYDGVRMGERASYNEGFWGQECGPEVDPSRHHKYMEDAISVNTDLEDTHFQSFHLYRLEWQPGPKGYLEWYLDDEFILGIDAETLRNVTGAIIPEEPMYLILNTAISHRWGMPEPCDINTCGMCWRCYDCLNPDCQCTLPDGMKDCANLPAEMQIDYIRLYQDPADTTHHTQCSPESHPTEQFIIDHADRYADWKPVGPWDDVSTLHTIIFGFVIVVLLIAIVRLFIFLRSRCSRDNPNISYDAEDPRSPKVMRTPSIRLDRLPSGSTEKTPLVRK